MQKLSELEKKIKYSFKDVTVLKTSLTHKGLGEINNQRLEFLGDAVLQICISEYLYKHFKNNGEGDLTKLRANLVCKNTLYKVAQNINLGDYLYLDRDFDKNGGRKNSGVLADAMEALLAAVYLDGGFFCALELVGRLWDSHIHNSQPELDIKGKLQLILQSKGKKAPEYLPISESGPIHKRIFSMAVIIDNKELARADGSSKKEAEKKAAQIAYNILLSTGEFE